MQQSQPIDSKQVEGFSGQFQRRWEAGFHWRSMCSMLLGTPGLRAAWPMSSVDFQNPMCRDISGGGYHLTNNVGFVTFGSDPTPGIAPVAVFGGAANQYLSRASAVGNWAAILGSEGQILAGQKGLSLGGWFWWAALPGAAAGLIFKDDGGANRQYHLVLNAANTVGISVWLGPVVVNSTATINVGWNHVVGLYDAANQDLHIVLNGVVTSNLGAAPAALANTAAPLAIGADSAGGTLLTGYASDCFLSAAFLSLGFVKAGYHYTKAAYGVK